MKKILILILPLFLYSYECDIYLTVGQIDPGYDITHSELKEIILEVENSWEDAVGKDFIHYSTRKGKPINIIISEDVERFEMMKQEAEEYFKEKENFNEYKEQLNSMKEEYEERVLKHNKKMKYNKYRSKKQFNKEYIILKDMEEQLLVSIEEYNDLVRDTENNINYLRTKYNINDTEKKGQASIRTKRKMVYHKGRVGLLEKSKGTKIDIFRLTTVAELKSVLAHEIGHLIGLEHIDEEGALMHTYLQENQKEKLSVTRWDSEAAKKALNFYCK